METALIAEDDEANQLLLRTILRGYGFKTIIADNGEEALAYYKKNKDINIVLLDMHMPYLSGLDVVRKIRHIEGREKRKHVPVIAVTAFAQKGNRETCLEAGCDAYIAKPFDQKNLLKLLNRYRFG